MQASYHVGLYPDDLMIFIIFEFTRNHHQRHPKSVGTDHFSLQVLTNDVNDGPLSVYSIKKAFLNNLFLTYLTPLAGVPKRQTPTGLGPLNLIFLDKR